MDDALKDRLAAEKRDPTLPDERAADIAGNRPPASPRWRRNRRRRSARACRL